MVNRDDTKSQGKVMNVDNRLQTIDEQDEMMSHREEIKEVKAGD